MLCVTGGLVLGEALNLWIPAEQMIFGLAVWLLFFVCVFARRKSRYRLPVFLFMAGMMAGSLRMRAEQAAFFREEAFFAAEHEDGVVLNGTVQSVKETDGTLEIVLRDCVAEEINGESGEKFRRVLCYLDDVEAEEKEQEASPQRISETGTGGENKISGIWNPGRKGIWSRALQEQERSSVFSVRERRQIRREIQECLITGCIADPEEFPGSSTRTGIR